MSQLISMEAMVVDFTRSDEYISSENSEDRDFIDDAEYPHEMDTLPDPVQTENKRNIELLIKKLDQLHFLSFEKSNTEDFTFFLKQL